MQITLLPSLLPTEAVTPVRTSQSSFTPGARLLATVIAAGLEGGTLLSIGGRQVTTESPLPHEAGTRLRLEVTRGGPLPEVRIVAVEAPAIDTVPKASMTAHAPVSPAGYALAAAVLAARDGQPLQPATEGMIRWLPALVTRGVLTPAEGDHLASALLAVPWPLLDVDVTEGESPTATLARILAARVANGGALLERRLGEVVRGDKPDTRAIAAGDLRSRLAHLAGALHDAPPALAGAREAVETLQAALLAAQARTAAHLAHDGVVDVRIALALAARETELRLRIQREAPEGDDEVDPAPWRQVRLDLELDGLGHVQVRLGLAGATVRTEFLVEHPDAADRIESGLLDLTASLEGAGFAQVLARVVIDPVSVTTPDALPDLPQRAIVDADA